MTLLSEVRNIDACCKHLEAAGLHTDESIRVLRSRILSKILTAELRILYLRRLLRIGRRDMLKHHYRAFESGDTGSKHGDAVLKIVKGLWDLRDAGVDQKPFEALIFNCRALLDYDLGNLDARIMDDTLVELCENWDASLAEREKWID